MSHDLQRIHDQEQANFFHNIRWLRQTYGIPKKHMARLLKISTKTLNRLEEGEMPALLSLNIYFHIQKYFAISPKRLLGTRLDDSNFRN